jgi:hypothetical protein
VANFKSLSSHFQPQLEAKQLDDANGLKIYTYAVPATFQIAQLASPGGFRGV